MNLNTRLPAVIAATSLRRCPCGSWLAWLRGSQRGSNRWRRDTRSSSRRRAWRTSGRDDGAFLGATSPRLCFLQSALGLPGFLLRGLDLAARLFCRGQCGAALPDTLAGRLLCLALFSPLSHVLDPRGREFLGNASHSRKASASAFLAAMVAPVLSARSFRARPSAARGVAAHGGIPGLAEVRPSWPRTSKGSWRRG